MKPLVYRQTPAGFDVIDQDLGYIGGIIKLLVVGTHEARYEAIHWPRRADHDRIFHSEWEAKEYFDQSPRFPADAR